MAVQFYNLRTKRTESNSVNFKMNGLNTAISINNAENKARFPTAQTTRSDVTMRRRRSAIESPSDLWIDQQKDSLLPVSSNERKQHNYQGSPINDHPYTISRRRTTNFNKRCLYETKASFSNALELYNRSQCREIERVWESQSFFECKGAIRVVQRMCTCCRDSDKRKTKTDLYYVDLTERTKERTILCHSCMGRHLNQHVGKDNEIINKELQRYRQLQTRGIFILPKRNTQNLLRESLRC